MSRFKNEITHLQAHIRTLRLGLAGLLVLTLLLGVGWWQSPRDLTIHVPPDLRSGSVRKWWEVPPESVYAFTFYIFQQLNRWPTNGEHDHAPKRKPRRSRRGQARQYPCGAEGAPVLWRRSSDRQVGILHYARNLHALSAYLTPACRVSLRQDYEYRRSTGELRERVRGLYEIPGRGYGDDPASRVQALSDRDWVVTLDVSADEYHGSEQVKRALVRYRIKVARQDHDPERGLPVYLSKKLTMRT